MQDTRFYAPPGFAALAASTAPKSDPTPEPSGQHGPSSQPTGKLAYPRLSPTELKVYDLLVQRMTEKQAAEALGRSPNTVHVHVRNIYRKLGVQTRQELFSVPRKLIAGRDANR